jgi:hypothetical protein
MSEQNPPSPTSPIFNSTYFYNTGDVIDKAYLEANYLQFPTTQGQENFFYSTLFQAGATFSNIIPTTSVSQTYPSSSTNQLSTIGYVNQATSSVSGHLSLIISTQPSSSPYQLTQLYQYIAIGGTPYQDWTSSTFYLPYDVSLNYYSGFTTTIRNNTSVSQSINCSPQSLQGISINSYNPSNPTQSSITLSAGTSVSLLFQSANNTPAGNWYVIGV